MKKDQEKTAAAESASAPNDSMKLDVRIQRMVYRGDSNVKAIADVGIGGMFAVKGIKVMSGPNGDFAAMPAEKGRDGKYYQTFHPITPEARQLLSDAVLGAYAMELAAVKKQSAGMGNGRPDFADPGFEDAASHAESPSEGGPSMAM
jgi:stage V sporulation protein G